MQALLRNKVPLLIGLAILLGLLGLVYVIQRNLGRKLDADRLDAARRLWREKGPASYILHYTIVRSDPTPDEYEVHVVQGKVVFARVNQEVQPASAFHHYGMEKLFDYIDAFLAQDAKKASGKASHLADFDKSDGHLLYYTRQVPLTTESVTIEVQSLE